MPKQKVHSGTKDRVKITKRGKVLMRKSYGSHNLSKKDSSRKRTFSKPQRASGKISKNIKRSLGR